MSRCVMHLPLASPGLPELGENFFAVQRPDLWRSVAATWPSLDRDSLNSHKVEGRGRVAFYLKAKQNGLANSAHEFVERACLRMAAAEGRNRRDVITLLVALDQHVEFPFHLASVLEQQRNSTLAEGRKLTFVLSGGASKTTVGLWEDPSKRRTLQRGVSPPRHWERRAE